MINTQNPVNQNRLWMMIMGVAIIVLFVIVLWPDAKSDNGQDTADNKYNSSQSLAEIDNLPVPTVAESDAFRSEVQEDIVVPDKDTVLSAEESKITAVPETVVVASPNSEAQLRIFNLTADKGLFEPKKIIVNLGDTVHINLTAVDKDYDLTIPSYNMRAIARQGQTKFLGFSAMYEGSFRYYCQSCGGPDGPASGQIIVVK